MKNLRQFDSTPFINSLTPTFLLLAEERSIIDRAKISCHKAFPITCIFASYKTINTQPQQLCDQYLINRLVCSINTRVHCCTVLCLQVSMQQLSK
ncbi:hypothetical protein GOODEAATRI_016823 [Goodea atripinnis]|uniref:Uncharacterized protein n=1 Tax=Goodea atripinnis TaxID=208336 RepID=A0ABV0PEN1_9TELE